jgi:hypothetical protein
LVVPTDDWEDGERKILVGFFGAGVTDPTESVSESSGAGVGAAFFFLALGTFLGLTALRFFVFFG